jgi:hypothetical protein
MTISRTKGSSQGQRTSMASGGSGSHPKQAQSPRLEPPPLPPVPVEDEDTRDRCWVNEYQHVDRTMHYAPRDETLDIGIPCIISSKRKRFKAYARYIGEVDEGGGSR